MGPRFIFCVHHHQPVGNFEPVFEKAYRECYLPFLEAVERHPWFRFCAHYSGPLLEWLYEHRLDFFMRLKKLVDRNQVELLGGAFYEPIFPILPSDDLQGQIAMMSDYLLRQFGVEPKGGWVTERVWEPSMASALAQSGLLYAVLDDHHFRSAGLKDEQLNGYYLTEDQGRLFRVFPLRERLRYAIPYRDPAETIEFVLREGLVVYADDGEKFGSGGWLHHFLEALEKNLDRISLTTFGEVLQSTPPAGKVYLPACSYREMGEWSSLSSGEKQGTWRNFLVKYPEASLMYGRMMQVSRKVNALPKNSTTFKRASAALYRGQCGSAYWHGSSGGIYLGHLRDAVYRNLIEAEKIIRGKEEPFGQEVLDLDLDGREELLLYNKNMNLFLSPQRGAEIVELDLLDYSMNLGAGFSASHSLVDRFSEGAEFQEFSLKTTKEPHRLTAVLSARGKIGGREAALEKTILLGRDATAIEAVVTIRNLSKSPMQGRYGLEFNLALLTPFLPDAFVHSGDFKPKGGLETKAVYRGTRTLGVCDRIRGLDVEFTLHQDGEFQVAPVQTDGNLQTVSVAPVWNLDVEPGAQASFTLIQSFGAPK